MDKKYMNFAETMEFLRLSRPTMNRLIARREIPSYKIGRLRLFDQEELIQWVKGHKDDRTRKVAKGRKGK